MPMSHDHACKLALKLSALALAGTLATPALAADEPESRAAGADGHRAEGREILLQQ